MSVRLVLLVALSFFGLGSWRAQAQPLPTPDAGGPPNIYYGANPPNYNGNVLVFIHGLRGVAKDWWVNNDMYQLAYSMGYKTAFININLDGTPNDASIGDNAKVLALAFPIIATRFGVPKFVVVAHSKGGIDTQTAILQPTVAPFVKSVFTVSTPHQGTMLADWAFGPGAIIAQPLGLQTPGVFSLQKSSMSIFRSYADPLTPYLNIPFYNMAGITSTGNPLTAITGGVLKALSPLQANDGLVTPGDTVLPITYATNLGLVNANHFQTNTGSLILPRIHAQINAGVPANFQRVDPGSGFGDRQNSFAWSQQWFNGKLYVGTGRAFLCVTAAVSDAQQGTNIYRPSSADLECAPTPADLALRAEIWRYTPESKTWERVFQSPQSIPLEFDSNGVPTKYTARDIAFRGMTVFTEPDGTKALYVGGVTGSAMFDKKAPYNNPATNPFPPPRILRSVDGVNWAPLPQTPGTFLGDIYKNSTSHSIRVRGFRSLLQYKGKLFATASDFRGVGFIVASANPSAGDNAWYQAGPDVETLPSWTLALFNGYLYTTTGNRSSTNGYGVYKTDASGPAPYVWKPVVTDGAYQIASIRSPDALSIHEFNGALYVGSDRPTELIRIYPDDTWDLLVGGPRNTPLGYKVPLTGLVTGFGNVFNGHFWRMLPHQGRLYVGTWDWSVTLRDFGVLGTFFKDIMGSDLFSSADGLRWNIETRTGFDDKFNYGIRNLISTPFGLFVGTANPFYGTQIWRNWLVLDLNGDRVIDQSDVDIITRAINTTVAPGDPRDLDEDGKITALDVRKFITQCTVPGCGRQTAAPSVAAPKNLQVAPSTIAGPGTLTWQATPNATRYSIYRQDQVPIHSLIPPNQGFTVPGTSLTFTLSQILAGNADFLCRDTLTSSECDMLALLKSNANVPGRVRVVGQTDAATLSFRDDTAPADGTAMYFVKAEDAKGNVSLPSNLVPSLSYAPAATFASVRGLILAAAGVKGIQQETVRGMEATLLDAATALNKGDVRQSRRLAEVLAGNVRDLVAKYHLSSSVWSQLEVQAEQLPRNILLTETNHIRATILLQRDKDELASTAGFDPLPRSTSTVRK